MELMKKLTLTFFVLRINVYVESDERSTQTESSTSAHRNRDILDVFNPTHGDKAVNLVVDASSTLTYISFDIMGYQPRYWSVKRTDSVPKVTELEPIVGRELVHTHGLVFNDRSLGISDAWRV